MESSGLLDDHQPMEIRYPIRVAFDSSGIYRIRSVLRSCSPNSRVLVVVPRVIVDLLTATIFICNFFSYTQSALEVRMAAGKRTFFRFTRPSLLIQ